MRSKGSYKSSLVKLRDCDVEDVSDGDDDDDDDDVAVVSEDLKKSCGRLKENRIFAA